MKRSTSATLRSKSASASTDIADVSISTGMETEVGRFPLFRFFRRNRIFAPVEADKSHVSPPASISRLRALAARMPARSSAVLSRHDRAFAS